MIRTLEILTVIGVVCAVAWQQTGSGRVMNSEHEAYYINAAVCAAGGGCPLVGPGLAELIVHLGPLFYYLLAAVFTVTSDPQHLYLFSVGLHALMAAGTLLLANRLWGRPWGLVAGLVVGLNYTLLLLLAHARHATFASLPILGATWGIVGWSAGWGARYLVLALASVAVASQMHALAVFLLLAVAFVWLWERPAAPQRAIALGAAVWAALYLPWLSHYIDTGFTDFLAMEAPSAGRAAMESELLTVGGSATRALGAPVWVALVGLGALLWDAFSRERPRLDRAVGRALTSIFFVACLSVLALRTRWYARYDFVFCPVAALLVAYGLKRLFGWARRGGPRPRVLATWLLFGVGLLDVARTVPSMAGEVDPLDGYRGSDCSFLRNDAQAAVFDALDDRGFRPRDAIRRVHGASWAVLQQAPWYMGSFMLDANPGADPAVHALIATGCDELPPPFARWQAALPPGREGCMSAIATYESQLSPPVGEVRTADGVAWRGSPALPILLEEFGHRVTWYGGRQPPLEMLGLLHEDYRVPEEQRELWRAWTGDEARALVLTTRLARGGLDRVVAVVHPPPMQVRVWVDGAPREAVQADDLRWNRWRTRFLIQASERRAGNEIRIELLAPEATREARAPIDLYEEPWPLCHARKGDGGDGEVGLD